MTNQIDLDYVKHFVVNEDMPVNEDDDPDTHGTLFGFNSYDEYANEWGYYKAPVAWLGCYEIDGKRTYVFDLDENSYVEFKNMTLGDIKHEIARAFKCYCYKHGVDDTDKMQDLVDADIDFGIQYEFVPFLKKWMATPAKKRMNGVPKQVITYRVKDY